MLSVCETEFIRSDQDFFEVLSRHHLQLRGLLDILQQSFFFPDLPFDPSFHLLDAALHCLCFRADVCPCSHTSVMFFDRIITDLCILVFLRPSGRPVGRSL